ncbi:MAG: hypothetical protein V2I36_09355 [Desulfopila sp.]|nr:hypothetical protein [Desulfopila sp.]
MRECRNNYAHGPMKLQTSTITVQYHGRTLTCERMVYACNFCDYELHEEWMKKKMEEQLAEKFKQESSS